MRQAMITLGLSLIIAGSAFTAGANIQHSIDSHSANLPACVEEDSANCIWDAGESGNGQGSSFIDFHGKLYREEN